MPKKEIEYMNVARAIGICLIVLGHSFVEESHSGIRSFVYLFHVPLFFIISGYFFSDAYVGRPAAFIVNRIKRLWLPFFRWSLLFVLLHNFFFSVYVYSQNATFRGYTVPYYGVKDIIKKIIKLFLFMGSEQLLGAFWFLGCLFFTVAIFLLLNILVKRYQLNKFALPSVLVLLFVIGNSMYAFDITVPVLPWEIQFFFITVFIYYIGYLYRQYESKIPLKLPFAIISLAVLLVINVLDFIKIDSISSTFDLSYKPVLYLVVTPVLGSYLVFYVSTVIVKTPVKPLFDYIGRNTIAILALHFLSFKIVNYVQVLVYGLDYGKIADFPVIPDSESWCLAYFTAGIVIPLAVNFLLNAVWTRVMARFHGSIVQA